MKHELKFPAQCGIIPAEEQELLTGGTPDWLVDVKVKVKDGYQTVKPYVDYGIEVMKAASTIVTSIYLITGYAKIIKTSCEGIVDCIKAFPW